MALYLDFYRDLKNTIAEDRLIDLTDDERLGEVNMARVDECIRDACAEFDSYAGVKYSVPIANPTDEVKRICKKLWICHMYERRTGNIPEDIKTLREQMTSTLRDIAKGVKTLGIDPAPAAPISGSPETNKTTNDRVFTRDSMKGF